jgi:DNA-binding response OmpR family regulator
VVDAPIDPANEILLIEDEPQVASALQLVLRQAHHPCDVAANAKTARELFDRKKYRVVITDVNIPDGDGIELVASFQQQRHVPIIVITGNPTLKSALAAMRISVVAFLLKPFEPETLLLELERALAAERSWAKVAQTIERVDSWRSELVAFDSLLGSTANPSETAAALLAMTARQLMEGMADLRLQIAALTASAPVGSAAGSALNASRPVALLEAIRDTIAVLDRTKDAFRSRELGELRKRLELLLGSERPAPPRQPAR